MPDDPNAPLHLTLRQAEELEAVEDDELVNYLVELAPEIGWIIIHFNSLEDHVSGCIREAIWAAAGFKDTLLRWKMKPEVDHGNEKAIQPRVQA